MTDCENLASFVFYTKLMVATPGIAEMYQRKYCKADNSNCARYIVYKALGKDKVPLDLYPNMLDRAKKIIEAD